MTTPHAIVAAARTLIGTPYLHQGRSPGPRGGVDCIGVPILICRQLGLLPVDFDFLDYGRDGSGKLEAIVSQHCQPIPSPKPGSLLLFRAVPGQTVAQHTAICTDTEWGMGMLHAYQNVGMVREHEMIPFWRDRLVGTYALPTITYEDKQWFSH